MVESTNQKKGFSSLLRKRHFGEKMKTLVEKIHKTPHKTVIAITGGGTEAIGELLRHGNGSATLLEAVVPYDSKAFDNFVRGTPDKYCSPGAARDLAMAAFQRAVNLTNTHYNMIGIGASSSLAKDGERVGREHHAYIAVQTANQTSTYILSLHNNGYSRENEEHLTSNAIIKALGHACQVEDYSPESFTTADETIADVVLGFKKVFTIETGYIPVFESNNRIIFPGAFNPLHQQHAAMAAKVSELTGQKIDLELCVRNVDKPALNYQEINARVANLKALNGNNWLKDIHLTSTPTFAEKSTWFPNSTFLVGWDTFRRISDAKYGNLNEVIETFHNNHTNFIVFHRVVDGKSSSEEDINQIHPELLKISKIYGADVLPHIEMSSSQIRKRALN